MKNISELTYTELTQLIIEIQDEATHDLLLDELFSRLDKFKEIPEENHVKKRGGK